MPEGEEEEQEIENFLEKIMKENFPNLKEINIQVQEAQRVPNKLDPKRTTPLYIIIKDKERIFKAARENKRVSYKGIPIRLSVDFSKETAGKRGMARSIQSDEKQGPTTKMTLSSKTII